MSFFGTGKSIFESTATNSVAQTKKDIEVPSPPSDTVSCLRFSPATANQPNTYLAGSSWDNRVRVWEVASNGTSTPKAEQLHQGPVLSLCWSSDGTKIFSVGADKCAQMWDLASNQFVQVGGHDAPIKTVHFISSPNYTCIMTGGWDKKLRFWDMRQPTPMSSLDLNERVYCADAVYPVGVVGCAGRQIVVYTLEKGPEVAAQIESPLSYQNRCISIFLDKQKQSPTGFALGSIEGRVAIQYFQPSAPRDNFTFKCHRSPTPVNGYYEIFPVNDVAFHPLYGTLATVGSDGRYAFWDKDARTKLRGLDNAEMPITTCTIDRSGNLFAYACGYDWFKGHEFADPNKPPKICMRQVLEEMKPSK
ncbi:mRNA export protein rae1 [Echinococcus multilocularis]|uniref:mRNA export protein rae1 n=1 Tax=Echinococcus multilocularis TaxID=6211 RepID=A0A068Y6G8_ECHMU|nr:mRNA export protein rae1 [Echinococcus multilocularis]